MAAMRHQTFRMARPGFFILAVLISAWLGGVESVVEAGQPARAKRVVAYVAGFSELYKIDLVARRILAEEGIPGSPLMAATFLSLPPDGFRLYVVGARFDAPVFAYDAGSLERKAELRIPGLPPPQRFFQGRFVTEEGFQASADGKIGVTFISDLEGDFGLQFMSLPDLTPTAWRKSFAFHVGRQSYFVQDGRRLVALLQCRLIEGFPVPNTGYCLSLIDTSTGATLKVVPLPWPLKGSVSADHFIPEAAGLYVVEAGNSYWVLPQGEKTYAYISEGKVVIAEVASGRVLYRHRIPGNRSNFYAVTLTPDQRLVLVSRGIFRPKWGDSRGDILILDRASGRMRGRISLPDGATSNVVFRYE